MDIYERIKERLRRVFSEEEASIIAESIADAYSDVARKSDLDDVRDVIKELAEAQKRTEEKIEKLIEAQAKSEERIARLEEAQIRTEERLSRLEEAVERLAEAQIRTEERLSRLEEAVERLAEAQARTEERVTRLEEAVERLAEAQRRTEEELQRFSRYFDMKLTAIGARWGVDSESSFRAAMKYILEDMGIQVEQYRAYDSEGMVFGRPSSIELDLIIKDGKLIVAEIKSSVNRADISLFEKKVDFYIQETGRQVDEKLIISPFVDPRGTEELADAFGIKIITNPEDIR